MEFDTTTLGQLSVDGKGSYGIAAPAVPYSDELYTYLRITDICDGGTLNKSGLMSVNADGAEKYLLEENDIVFARTGNSTGRNYFYDGSDGRFVYAGFLIKFSLDSQKVNPRFIKYYCQSKNYWGWVQSFNTGSTRGNINAKDFANMEIVIPSREQQDFLVNILKPIDEKIKLNQRINDNLRQQAQEIYMSRFTDTNGCLANICQYSKEKTLVSQLTLDNYYSTENMLPEKGGSVQAASLPTTVQTTYCGPGDVLVSNIRPYFKKIVYCSSEGGCSTDVLCFTPKEEKLSAYLFYTLYADKFFDYMLAGSKGTKMPRGDKQQIMTYPIHVPSDTELTDYNSIAQPILTKIEKNREENLHLTALRDTLLPKLMSGEIDVSSLKTS
ncbi:MAG: restriction endonuclease subunit S [Oscillospiraceae bacterium]|nr:restriction endonuclease subunit S [Oscillospiraceae bacterium]